MTDGETFNQLTEFAERGRHAPGSEEASEEETRVYDLLLEQLDPDRIHGLTLTARTGLTYYIVVATTQDREGGEALDLRTVVVDLQDEEVRVTDNGLWVPADSEVSEGLLRLLSRSTSDLSGGLDSETPPAQIEAADGDLGGVLSSTVGDSGAEEDSSGSGSDKDHIEPEIDILAERLSDAGISAKRFNNLEFGSKAPWSHDMRSKADVMGNYGVYVKKTDPLIIVDVDEPEEAPDLPETFAVSSPHGTEDRAHRFYKVEGLDRLNDGIPESNEKWNFKPSWGDIQIHNRYVAGPGSRLDAEGCDTGPYSKGDPEGCSVCESPEGGRYEIVANRPIEVLSVETVREWVETDPDARLPEARSSVSQEAGAEEGSSDSTEPEPAEETEEPVEEPEEGEAGYVCHECGRILSESSASRIAGSPDDPVMVCSGGCR
jgi:hypothetical protein